MTRYIRHKIWPNFEWSYSMPSLQNAYPHLRLLGIDDQSKGTFPIQPEQTPTHLPHVFLYTEKGPLEPQIVIGNTLSAVYGLKSVDMRGKFANHQTVLATTVAANGNAILVQRMKPLDAPDPSSLCLSIEVVADDVPEYERNIDGSIRRDSDGVKVETGLTIPGFKARWVLSNHDATEINARTRMDGMLTSSTGDLSTRYPIMDLQVSSFGEHGNNKGLRLWAPTAKSQSPADVTRIENVGAFIYQAQMIERPDAKTRPNVIKTKLGSPSISFSFKPNAIDPATDNNLDVDQIFLDTWRNLEVSPPMYGNFNEMKVYHDNINEVINMVYSSEKDHQPDWDGLPQEDIIHLINFLTGEDQHGNEYNSFIVEGVENGGIEFTEHTNHYSAGGGDGTINDDLFNDLVRNECENYGSLEWDFLNMGHYPQSIIWDSGFSLEAKKSLFVPMGLRKDMMTIAATQVAGARQNTPEEELSMTIALRTYARLFPESVVYGTHVCRAAIIGHSGELLNHQYTGILPLTIDLADKVSKYMGASNGNWKADEGFDDGEKGSNVVTMFKTSTVNHRWKPDAAYIADWDNGVIGIRSKNRTALFYPGFQTVYDDPTSTLNSLINVFGFVELEKIAYRTWTKLTSNAKLTDDQFIERSDRMISDEAQPKFDGRFIIVPQTEFTDFDKGRGMSWTTNIIAYANNERVVGTTSIISRRRNEYAG